jgi:hypothetical protein
VQTYHAVLYIHLLSLLIAVAVSGIIHVSDIEMRRAQTLGEVGRAGLRIKNAAMGFPIAVIGLVGSGVYMAHHLGWGWTSPWILAGEVGLFTIVAVGDAVNARHGKKLGEAIGAAMARGGDGPVTAEVKELLDDPVAKFTAVMPTLLALGVVYVMTEKPGALGSALALAIAFASAAVIGPLLLRAPKPAAEAPIEAPAAESA